MKFFYCSSRLLCWFYLLFNVLLLQAQAPNTIQYTPGGLLDNVYDHYGNHYSLDDIRTNKEDAPSQSKFVDPTCNSGIFRLHFTTGSGFLDNESPNAAARRAVVCQVFNDLSNFINSPLHNTGNTQKVEIWVRDINALVTPANSASTSQFGGMASSFYILPTTPTAITVSGGIIDNEVWKTIHTGIDSYTNVTPPIISGTGANSGSSIFYHGYVALNFHNTNIHWNLGTTPMLSDETDLYTVILHEVTHALGFASLIDSNGQSRFGNQGNYYTRYDNHLQSFNNIPLLTQPTGTISTLYNYTYTQLLSHLHPNPADCQNNTTTCATAIRYAGTNTIPVYTPNCYEPASSLSHFEDMCNKINPVTTAPPGNDLYYTMSNGTQSGTTKRFLRTEERNTLCDIGYSLQDTFAGLPTTTTNYTTGNCEGIRVAGINDGISNGSYSFMGTVGNTITIPINGTTIQAGTGNTIQGILRNDFNGITNTPDDIRIEGLQDVYDINAIFNGSQSSFSSNAFVTTITYTTNVSGVHLLRYVPVVNGVRGNITYVYVFVREQNLCATLLACNELVYNGNFEQFSLIPDYVSQINRACNWVNGNDGTSDYLHRNSINALTSIPNNSASGFKEVNPVSGGDAFARIICNSITNISNQLIPYYEIICTRLKTPLQSFKSYRLRFDVSRSIGSDESIQFQALLSTNAPIYLPGANYGEIPFTTGDILLNNSTFSTTTGWETITFDFSTNSISGQEYLFLGGIRNVNFNPAMTNIISLPTSYFIDNVSLIEIYNNNTSFSITPDTLCVNTSTANLFTFIEGVPTDGTFSWSLNGGAFTTITGNTFTPTTAGTYTINYTYTNNVGCTITISDTITVTDCNTPVTPTFNAIAPLCQGSTPPALPSSSTNNPSIVGTWNPSTISTATAGTFTYTFTPNAGQNATTATLNVTVNPRPTAPTITGNSRLCYGISTVLTASIAGGTWSCNNTNATLTNTTTNSITLTNHNATGAPVSATVSYTITNGTCSTTVTYAVNLLPDLDTGVLDTSITLCVGSTILLNYTVLGSWSITNTNIATVNTETDEITGVSAGTTTLYFTVYGYRGCSKKVAIPVTVYNTGVPTFNLPLELCVSTGGSYILPTTSTNGISGTWTPASISTGTVGIKYATFTPNSSCASPITIQIAVIKKRKPIFNSLNNLVVCQGGGVPLLPSASDNGITGTWSPSFVNNMQTGSYTFYPDFCANAYTITIQVITPFVLQNDSFTVIPGATTINTPTVLANDSWSGIGNTLNNPNSYTPAFTVVATPPTPASGSITLNPDGSFGVAPGTTAGTYTFEYHLNSDCGDSQNAQVSITIPASIESPGKISMEVCYNTASTNSTASNNGVTNLFYGTTIGGQPASSGNATIQLVSGFPAGWSLNTSTGVVTTSPAAMPGIYAFYFKVCDLNGTVCGPPTKCTFTIPSTIHGQLDVVYYNTNGFLIGPAAGNSYNVLTNDYLYNCTTNTQTPLVVSGAGQNATFTSNPLYGSSATFSWHPSNIGQIVPNTTDGITEGIYYLEYTICDVANPSICVTVPVNIHVWDNSNAITAKTIASTPTQTTTQSNTTTTDCSVNICFNDPNLKAIFFETDPWRVYNLDLTGNSYVADTNGDGEISYAEALLVGGLSLATSTTDTPFDIHDFTGLQYFTNLKNLNIALNTISVLNYNQFPSSIERFNMSDNPISSFDASHFPNLKFLNSSKNSTISTLDLGGNHNFTELVTKNCPNLTSINIKNGIDQDVSSTTLLQQDCWANCPNLSNVCVDTTEMASIQNYLTNCGGNASIVNSNCALGTENPTPQTSLNITPNPTKGVFTISCGTLIQPTQVTVYDTMGRMVYNNNFNKNNNDNNIKLDLTAYPSGIYIVEVKTNTEIVRNKVVKE